MRCCARPNRSWSLAATPFGNSIVPPYREQINGSITLRWSANDQRLKSQAQMKFGPKSKHGVFDAMTYA